MELLSVVEGLIKWHASSLLHLLYMRKLLEFELKAFKKLQKWGS